MEVSFYGAHVNCKNKRKKLTGISIGRKISVGRKTLFNFFRNWDLFLNFFNVRYVKVCCDVRVGIYNWFTEIVCRFIESIYQFVQFSLGKKISTVELVKAMLQSVWPKGNWKIRRLYIYSVALLIMAKVAILKIVFLYILCFIRIVFRLKNRYFRFRNGIFIQCYRC